MSAEEKTIMQSIVVIKALCRARGIVPLSVELVEGTSQEYYAWRQEAAKYLTAKREGRIYIPETRNLDEEIFGDS
jgi:hypothetical protein